MNHIDIVFNDKKSTFDKATIDIAIKSALEALSIKNSDLELIVVDTEEIATLNAKYRNIAHPTDVLSFPQIDITGAKRRHLGSIIICPEIINNKSEKIEDVVKHGILHLLGYDHESDLGKWDKIATSINCNL